jgi:hypothetical protein
VPALAEPAGKAPSQARPPESLLPADSLAYFRYDGYEPHRKAYDRTALARAMKDDLGDFLAYLGTFLRDALAGKFDGGGADAAQARAREQFAAQLPGFLDYLWRHGLAATLEIPGGKSARLQPDPLFNLPIMPGRAQLTVVFPEGGTPKNRDVLFPFLKSLAATQQLAVKERRLGERALQQADAGDRTLAWWPEGNHLVFTLGTEPVERAVEVIGGRRPSLMKAALLQDLAGFNRYETDIRGFVDLKQVVALLGRPEDTGDRLGMLKEAMVRRLLLSQLGLGGLKSLSFQLGFEGKYQRSTVVLKLAEPRRRVGLLRLVSGPVDLTAEQLPALPPDAAGVSVRHVNWTALYDVVDRTARQITLAGAVGEGRLPKGEPFDLDRLLGIDFRKDFLATLDSTVVLYNALSEGPFLAGQVVAVKVKDASKLETSLQAIAKAVGDALGAGAQFGFEKQNYRGADLHVLSRQQQFPVPVTYTIHKGWLVLAPFPQPVKGFVLRGEGKHKVWEMPELARAALARAGKEAGPRGQLAAVTVTDPRPSIAVGLSLLPTFLAFADQSRQFDVTKIPTAQAVNEWLFPGVTVLYDDGDAWRWESHFSVVSVGDLVAPGALSAQLAFVARVGF